MIRIRGGGVGGNDSLMRPRQKREETIKKKRCIWSAICLWHRSKKKSLVPVLETKLLRFNLSQPTHTGCFILWRQKMSSADIIPYCRVEGQKNRTCHKKGRREGGSSSNLWILHHPGKNVWRAQNALWNSGKSSMNDVVVRSKRK